MVKVQRKLLILLIAADNAELGAAVRPLLLLQDERAVRGAEQTVRAGDHVEAVLGFQLARMMDNQQTDVVLVAERLELRHDLIVVGVVVLVPAKLPHLLQRVYDDEFCVWMLLDEHLELIAQSAANRAGLCCEVERIGSLHAKHLEQTLLNARVIVLQSKVEHLARMDVILPEGRACSDVIAELRHEERFANLGRTDEQVRSRVEKILDNHRLRRIGCVIQICH